MTTFRLAIEEVAFAMAYLGGADTAAGFLTSLIGQRGADDLAGRLTAGSHSLMARALLGPGPTLAEATLDATLRQAIESMLRGDDVLRVTATANDHDRVVSFFLTDAGAVQHELTWGVVSEISVLDTAAQVHTALAGVVAPAELPPSGAEPLGRISADRLRELRLRANTASAAELAALASEWILPAVAPAVAAVLVDASATWTVTLRLVTGEAGTVESSRGFFTVFVQDAGWLFDMSSDPLWASVYALHHSTAAAATARLMAA